MIKKYLKLIIILIISFLFIDNAYAINSYVTIIDTAVQCRSGASTKHSSLGTLTTGADYTLRNTEIIVDEAKNGTCDGGWYQIDYNGKVGYVCAALTKATIVNIEVDATCEETMLSLGFPQSYVKSLCELKAIHATWEFVPINTELDWTTVVSKESTCGKSYIATSNQDYIDSTCKNKYTKTWYPASQTAVAFYMDPRNWLTERYIFQFNTNKYESTMSESYKSLAKYTIKDTNFYSYHSSIGNDLPEIINEAGKNTNVSPIFLSSRMLQELGSSTSEYDLYSGVFRNDTYGDKYLGYYNFFNIGVTDSCATSYGTAYCGLNRAKDNGWNTPLLAIQGGSSFLAKNYISVGQYTTYFQKYNVKPTSTSSRYLNQYMTNVAAPSSEASIAYNTYVKAGMLESPFVFYIPVYLNMGDEIVNSGSGATGEAGDSNVSKSSVSTIVSSAGYKLSSSTITGINPNSAVSDIKGSIESVAGTGNVTIYNSKDEEVVSGAVGTGYKISITNYLGTSTIKVVIKGDTSGDGIINALDLLQVQKDILGSYALEDEALKAADTSGDGEVNALDLLQVQKNILGNYSIKQ